VEKCFLDSGTRLVIVRKRILGHGAWRRVCSGRGRAIRDKSHFEMCPSRNKTVFICDRRSGSWIAGVYVEAALGTLTGVVGSDAIVLVFVGGLRITRGDLD